MHRGNEVYRDLQISTEVEAASPHRQIQMLLEKCLEHLRSGQEAVAARDIQKKCNALSKAMDIISYLKICLDLQSRETQELASNLFNIYRYSEKRLIEANIGNKAEYIREVENLIQGIKESWDQIA